MNNFFENFIISFVVLSAVSGLGYGGYVAYKHSQSPTFELYKDEFTCTTKHTQVNTTLISDGKGNLTPYVTSTQVCDTYTRIIK